MFLGFSYITSTDEDSSLRMENFAIINLRGVSKKLNYIGQSYCISKLAKLVLEKAICSKLAFLTFILPTRIFSRTWNIQVSSSRKTRKHY